MDQAGVTQRELEDRILDAARSLMAGGGVEAVSMRAVAELVGVSATALYHYFENKQDLVNRVVVGAFAEFSHRLEAAMRPHPAGSLERVGALGEAYIGFAQENQEYFRVIFSIQLPDARALDDLPGGGGYPLLRQAVLEAMDAGAMRRADPDLVSLHLWSMVHGLVTLCLACRLDTCGECQSSDTTPQELFHAFGPFIRQGLAAPGSETGDPSEDQGVSR